MTKTDYGQWLLLSQNDFARRWIMMVENRQLMPNTIKAYGDGLEDYLAFCLAKGHSIADGTGEQIALWIGDMRNRPNRLPTVRKGDTYRKGLSRATVVQRLTAVRLFYDFLITLKVSERNPVERGCYSAGKDQYGQPKRGLIPTQTELPRIPTDEQWLKMVAALKPENLRNKFMFYLAYDGALRREELCLLRIDDFDPSDQALRIRAETTKWKKGRVVIYSKLVAALFKRYLEHRKSISKEGALYSCPSRRETSANRSPNGHGQRWSNESPDGRN